MLKPLSVERLEGQTLAEPVTLAELKAQCRIDHEEDDAWLTWLITAARDAVEQATQRSLIPSTWVASFGPTQGEETAILPRPAFIGNAEKNSVSIPAIKTARGGIITVKSSVPFSVSYMSGACSPLAKMAVLLWSSHLYELRQPFGDKVEEVPASLTEFIARLRVINF